MELSGCNKTRFTLIHSYDDIEPIIREIFRYPGIKAVETSFTKKFKVKGKKING